MAIQPGSPVLSRNFTIPTLPSVVQRLQKLLEQPDAGVREIAAVVEEDAPLAAKVLKIANSSFYGLREKVVSTRHAASVLGVRVLRGVVTQASVIKQFEHLDGVAFDLDALWRHSILCAQASQFAGRRARGAIGLAPDELHACGLLHDLGKVVLLDNLRERYLELVATAQERQVELVVVEREALGFDHAEVGHVVATRWSLPAQVCGAILLHHAPRGRTLAEPAALLVERCNQFVHACERHGAEAAIEVFDREALRALGLLVRDVEELSEFVQSARGSVEI